MNRMITEGLCELYDICENELYEYLALRHLIVQNKAYYEEEPLCNIVKYIVEQLNLSIIDDGINYYGQSYKLKDDIFYIADGIKRRTEDHVEISKGKRLNPYLRDKMDDIRKYALKDRANKYPREHISTYFKHYGLKRLNKMYSANPGNCRIIEGVKYLPNHNPFKRIEEEILDANIDAIEIRTKHIKYLTEKSLEDYLSNNLNKIERGLTFISRQVRLPQGRIDILAKDKDGRVVIIELKTEEDKDILWQSTYYKEEIGKKYGQENVRMLVMAPKFSSSIKKMLKTISKAETLTYTPLLEYGKVIDIKTSKI